MNKQIFELLLHWPRPYISGTDLYHILDKSPHSRHAIIKRAIRANDLAPIRRDFYLIKNTRQPLVNAFEIAPIIYGPSYISFESALSYHGWIPEAVKTITSASVKRTKEFDTPIGVFSYEHIPIEAFPIGVEQHPHNDLILFIAAPVKALADMIYARKRIWARLDDLCEDLRIEHESFKDSDQELLESLIQIHPTFRVRKALALLKKGLPS